MFRPVLLFTLLTTVFIFLVDKSTTGSEAIMACHDEMQKNFVVVEIRNTYQPYYKKYLCSIEEEAILSYNNCFKEVNSLYNYNSISVYNKLSWATARFFRPTFAEPSIYAIEHNYYCSEFDTIVLN